MAELALAAGEVGGGMAIAAQQVAVGHQAFQPHGTPRRQGLGADAHLGAEAVAEAIGEAGGAVQIHTGAVHPPQEPLRRCFVAGADRIGVAGAMAADVGQGLLQGVDHLDGQHQVGILRAPVRLRCGDRNAQGLGGLVAAQFDTGGAEGRHGCGQEGLRNRAMQQQGFDRVAGRRVLGFGIDGDRQGLVQVGGAIHIEVADAIGVAQHRNAGVVLDEAHQLIGAPRNDQVHQAIELEQGQALLPRGEQGQGLGRHRRAGQARLQGRQDCRAAAAGLAAALEQGAIAGADRQGGDLHHRIGPGFKNHPQHPQGHAQPLQHQAIG